MLKRRTYKLEGNNYNYVSMFRSKRGNCIPFVLQLPLCLGMLANNRNSVTTRATVSGKPPKSRFYPTPPGLRALQRCPSAIFYGSGFYRATFHQARIYPMRCPLFLAPGLPKLFRGGAQTLHHCTLNISTTNPTNSCPAQAAPAADHDPTPYQLSHNAIRGLNHQAQPCQPQLPTQSLRPWRTVPEADNPSSLSSIHMSTSDAVTISMKRVV